MANVWANSMACHPRATYHIAGCCHLVNIFTVTIPELHATLQDAVTWQKQCHDRAKLQGVRIPSAILKIAFRHIYSKVICFNAVLHLTSGGFCIVSDITLVLLRLTTDGHKASRGLSATTELLVCSTLLYQVLCGPVPLISHHHILSLPVKF